MPNGTLSVVLSVTCPPPKVIDPSPVVDRRPVLRLLLNRGVNPKVSENPDEHGHASSLRVRACLRRFEETRLQLAREREKNVMLLRERQVATDMGNGGLSFDEVCPAVRCGAGPSCRGVPRASPEVDPARWTRGTEDKVVPGMDGWMDAPFLVAGTAKDAFALPVGCLPQCAFRSHPLLGVSRGQGHGERGSAGGRGWIGMRCVQVDSIATVCFGGGICVASNITVPSGSGHGAFTSRTPPLGLHTISASAYLSLDDTYLTFCRYFDRTKVSHGGGRWAKDCARTDGRLGGARVRGSRAGLMSSGPRASMVVWNRNRGHVESDTKQRRRKTEDQRRSERLTTVGEGSPPPHGLPPPSRTTGVAPR